MKLTREQARYINLINKRPFYKNKLKKSGEIALYLVLKKEYSNGRIVNMTIAEYIEQLKKEIGQENNAQDKNSKSLCL